VEWHSRQLAHVAVASALLMVSIPAVACGTNHGRSPDSWLQAAIERLVGDPNGPPGAIVLVQRGSHLRTFIAGVADADTRDPMRPGLSMRIASTSKAYNGGVALTLVDRGVLSLDDTIGVLLPWAPTAWASVTLVQALHHTSGLPDISSSDAFRSRLLQHPTEPVSPDAC